MMEDNTVVLSFDELTHIKPENKYRRVPIAEYTLEGKLIKVHRGIHDASQATSVSRPTIVNCCRGVILSVKDANRIFLYGGEDIAQRLQKIEKEGDFQEVMRVSVFPIREYSVNGTFLKTWGSVQAVTEAFQISRTVLKKHLENPCRPLKGRFFLRNESKIYDSIEAWLKEEQKRLERESLKKCAEEVCSIDIYTSGGEFLRTCKNVKEVSDIYKIPFASITNSLYGQALVTRGLMFLHHGEDIQERLNKVKNRKTWKKNL